MQKFAGNLGISESTKVPLQRNRSNRCRRSLNPTDNRKTAVRWTEFDSQSALATGFGRDIRFSWDLTVPAEINVVL